VDEEGIVLFMGRAFLFQAHHKQFGIKNYKLCAMTGCTYGRADTWEWTDKMQHRYDNYISNSKHLKRKRKM
jgi:hypothetical protein